MLLNNDRKFAVKKTTTFVYADIIGTLIDILLYFYDT